MFLFCSVCGAGDKTKDLAHARQGLSLSSTPVHMVRMLVSPPEPRVKPNPNVTVVEGGTFGRHLSYEESQSRLGLVPL